MIIGVLIPILLASAPAGTTSAVKSDDRLIVPGVRVGAVTAQVSEADLVKIYGAAQVRQQDSCSEGECSPATDLFPDDPKQKLTVIWADPKARRGRSTVAIVGAAWKTAEGVGVGVALSELTRLNGKAFDLAGFGWDGAGIVLDWHGGALEKYDPTTQSEKDPGRLRADPKTAHDC